MQTSAASWSQTNGAPKQYLSNKYPEERRDSSIHWPNTNEFHPRHSILFCDSFNPFWKELTSRHNVLVFPCFEVKFWFGNLVIFVFPMFPNGILIDGQKAALLWGVLWLKKNTYSPKVVYTQGQISRFSEAIHEKKPISEESVHVREVQNHVPIPLSFQWAWDICFNTCNGRMATAGGSIVDRAS